MIDLLVRAIEKGIELARESEKNRRVFFDSVVEPINQQFLRLYSEHQATFSELRLAADSGTNPATLHRIIESNALNQGGTAELLLGLTEENYHYRTPPRGSLAALYENYIGEVGACLLRPSPNHPFRVGAFNSAAAAMSYMSQTPLSKRELHASLDAIVADLSTWYARVGTAHTKLRIECAK